MLKGIVKPNGEIVSMDEVVGRIKYAAGILFDAGLLCGVNENAEMVICKNGNEVPVKIQESGPKVGQGNNGEVPSKEEEKQWEQDFEDQEKPAEPQGPQPAEPARSAPNEPKPGSIKPWAKEEKKPASDEVAEPAGDALEHLDNQLDSEAPEPAQRPSRKQARIDAESKQ